MARPKIPTIPDDKIFYFREQLYRELAHMFTWEGLPQAVPQDYLERNLIRYGYVMYYQEESIGQDVLRAEVMGWNRHELPVSARTFTPTTIQEVDTSVTRNIKRLADGDSAQTDFDPKTDCVLIQNMAYGQNMGMIVDHFATRLALAQQAFDTNLMWANIPYIFQTSSDETKLSIERMFSDIFTGKPFIISDKDLFKDNTDRAGVPSGIDFIAKDLMDVKREIMMEFKQTVGFNTAGVDKAERVNTMEIESNDQHTATVVQVMLEQREIAVESINAFFGTSISVSLVGESGVMEQEEMTEEGEGEEDGREHRTAGLSDRSD